MQTTKPKHYHIQKSNLLNEADYSALTANDAMSIDGYRILLMGMSNACTNLLNNPDAKDALTVCIKTQNLQSLFPSFSNAGNIHKRIDQATGAFIGQTIKLYKDEGHWKKTMLISNIKYVGYSTLIVKFNETIRHLFNPESKFTRYLINDTAKLRSYQQIRIYELCYQYIKIGERVIDITSLKRFVGINKHKTTSDLIREMKDCINQINKHTNLEIEFETIKTSRKITHIKFIFCRTDIHPLATINQERQRVDANRISKTNNIKDQLIALGFKKARLSSLLKIPVEVLTQAISATQKVKATTGFNKSIEACFFYQVGIVKTQNITKHSSAESPTKIAPSQLVAMFKDNLSVKEMRGLWNEFYSQLSKEQQTAYSKTNTTTNKTTKVALELDFTIKFNRWIYETKIKQQ